MVTETATRVRRQLSIFGGAEVVQVDESETDGWSTPQAIIDPVLQFWPQGIDVDPATNARSIVPARTKYTIVHDGLTQAWGEANAQGTRAKVWINPPYSDPFPWCERAQAEHLEGLSECLMLLKGDWTPAWWQRFVREATARCELSKRVQFHRRTGEGTVAPWPSVLVYFGPYAQRFEDTFAPHGEIVHGGACDDRALLRMCAPHVFRQVHAGKHEQDREDAEALVTVLRDRGVSHG